MLILSDYVLNFRKWHIQATCGISGVGLYEALALMSAWGSEYKQQQHYKGWWEKAERGDIIRCVP